MPVFSTLGSLAEFKRGYTFPNAVSNIIITRPIGYDINVSFTIGNTIPPGLPETYFATTIPGNFSNSSTNNNITITKIDPLETYNVIVYANNAGGSNNTTSNSFYMSSNLVANGNVTIANLVTMDIAPNSNQLCAITSTGRLLRYSRNNSTGQLTLLANTLIANNVLLDAKYSSDGNFIYILGRTSNANVSTNEVYAFTLANSNIRSVVSGSFAGYSKKLNTFYQPCKLIVTPDNKSVVFTGYNNSSSTLSEISVYNFQRTIANGSLSLNQTIFNPIIANGSFTSNTTITNLISSFDSKNIYLSISDAFSISIAQISVLSRNTSNTTLSDWSAYNLSNGNNAVISNIICSIDNNSFYVSQSGYSTLKTYTRSNTGNLTLSQTVSAANATSIINPANTILITNNNNETWKRNVSTGNLTIEPNTTTFTSSGVAYVTNDNYNVYSIFATNIRIFNITS